MRILMLGNSFIFFNDLPALIAKRTDAEVVSHTRGGAYLSEHLDPTLPLGVQTQKALAEKNWDYVILQGYSNGPIVDYSGFQNTVQRLCEQVRAVGAVPVLYSTWAYQKNGKKLLESGLEYEEMYGKLSEAYKTAAETNHALLAEVGKAFFENAEKEELYRSDSFHPTLRGSEIAADVIAEVINRNANSK